MTNIAFGGLCTYLIKALNVPNAAQVRQRSTDTNASALHPKLSQDARGVQDYPARTLRATKDSSLCLTLLTAIDRLFLSWWLVVHKQHPKNAGKPMGERKDVSKPTKEDFKKEKQKVLASAKAPMTKTAVLSEELEDPERAIKINNPLFEQNSDTLE
jgi:hypothetical protein